MESKYSDKKICVFMYALVLLMMIVLSSPLSISYILDETGTVANAAFLAGENWNDWVNHTGRYFYKYGQAVFYYPILKFVSNPYLLYKLLLIVNGVFLAWIPVFVYKILRKHLQQNEQIKCVLASLCVSVVPGSVLYSLFTRAEAFLMAFSWVTLFFILETLDAKDIKKQMVCSAMTGFISVYMYMCHSRGIVFVIAVFMILFAIRFIFKNKNVIFSVYLLNVVIWLFVDKQLTAFFKNSIWGPGIKKNTFEKVNVDKYANLLTLDGIDTVIKNITGWLFNSFAGTFGFVILGLVFATVGIIIYIQKKNMNMKEFVICAYTFLIYFGTLALGTLFSFGSNYKFVIGQKVKRSDRFLYSRYVAVTYSVIIFVALFYLFFKKDVFGIKTKITTLVLAIGLILYCRTWLKDFVNNIEYSWRNTIDSAMLFDTVRYGNDANKYTNVSRALLLMAVVSFIVIALVILLTHYHMRFKKQNFVLILIGTCFLISLSVNYVKLRLYTDIRPMLTVGSCISQLNQIEDETNISEFCDDVYVDKSISRYKMMQLALPMFTIHVRKSLDVEEVQEMLILCTNYHADEGWLDNDCYYFKNYDFENTRTTVLVKGEKLKNELEEEGYELAPITEEYLSKSSSNDLGSPKEALIKSLKYQWESLK